MTAIATRPVIRASVADVARLAEFLSLLLDAPVMITSARDEVSTPPGHHLILIVSERGRVITEIRLVSNNGLTTARFWSAVFNVPAEKLRDGQWRIAPETGPAVRVTTTPVWQAITRVDLTVTVDVGAPDRLRTLGFEVAHDGSQAVDVNGTDATVHLVVMP